VYVCYMSCPKCEVALKNIKNNLGQLLKQLEMCSHRAFTYLQATTLKVFVGVSKSKLLKSYIVLKKGFRFHRETLTQ
jgi:hypothetical protein